MKPKINRATDMNVSQGMDRCMTPAYALDPLLPYINSSWTFWEPTAGTGNIVKALSAAGHSVFGTDILGFPVGNQPLNFFTWQPLQFDALITNPPYSCKYDFLARCYDIGKPFALLVPVEMIGAQAAQRLMEKHGVELLLLNRRVNFEMPNKGWSGSSAQFPVLWLCWKMLPSPIVYGRLTPRAAEQNVMELV